MKIRGGCQGRAGLLQLIIQLIISAQSLSRRAKSKDISQSASLLGCYPAALPLGSHPHPVL